MALLGGLIHVFNILETERLKKFTIYKIQMISFPKNEKLFHCLTKLTVTKRYSDFKKLEYDLQSIYKCYNFKRFFKSDTNYFKRFEPEVIEQRKHTILEFLYYCAENPIIYRSQCFVKFFGDTPAKVESPVLERSETFESQAETNESIEEEDEPSVDEADITEADANEIPASNFDDDIDYLYDAALSFSQAVQAEANLKYKCAFDLYKCGIDKLLTGAKSDNKESRKRIAKTKASKYLEKAEQLFENYILQEQENEFLVENSDLEETQSISSFERPYSNMSRFKVIQINDRIMKVQDRTDKKIYIIKVIWKDHSHKILFLPQNVPYMVNLLNYFHSENAIFLLLPYVSGGLLWNYINTYSPDTSQLKIEELFVDPPTFELPVSATIETQDLNEMNEKEDERWDQEKSEEEGIQNIPEEIASFDIPSFDTLASDIDVNDLMKCSQNLLKSVAKTLEKSVVLSSAIDIDSQTVQNTNKTEQIDENKKEAIATAETCLEKVIPNEKIVRKIEQLPELVLKRWASEIILCVNGLHKNGIVLGDLNLNNILLGSNGHITITYFHQRNRSIFQNLCSLDPRAVKCMYVAPDFPLTKKSDWYSVGVVLYEILSKDRFYIMHPQGIYKFNELQFSEKCSLSDEAKDLLHNLIIRKSDERPSFDDLKSHPFFYGISFESFEQN